MELTQNNNYQQNQINHTKTIIFLIIFLMILLISLSIIYILFLNYFPQDPVTMNPLLKKTENLEMKNLSGKIHQFYPNMKFNHNRISYSIEHNCNIEQISRMVSAFKELSERVGYIQFYPETNNPDIDVSCSEEKKNTENPEYFIAGEGGAKEIIQTGRYNVISKGKILLHGNPHGWKKCSWSNVELHELLHVFGFDHSQNPNSLMYPYLKSCDQKLDSSIVEDLKILYSSPDLPDLYFDDIVVIKKGRFVDFNVTVKNSGVVDADNVILTIYDEGKKVEDFNLGSIPYGAGINYQVENLKILHRNSKHLEFGLDSQNKIKELDENNNLAIIE